MSQFAQTFQELRRAEPGVVDAVVVDLDGLVVASSTTSGIDDEQLGAQAAALSTLLERITSGLQRGQPEQVYVKATEGYVAMTSVADRGLLLCTADGTVKLGSLLGAMRTTAAALAKLL